MSDRVTNRMDSLWTGIRKAFKQGQKKTNLEDYIRVEQRESEVSVRLSSVNWVTDQTHPSLLVPDPGALQYPYMWEAHVPISLDKHDEDIQDDVRAFGERWIDGYLRSIIELLGARGPVPRQATGDDLRTAAKDQLGLPCRVLCGVGMTEELPNSASEYFDKPLPVPTMPSHDTVIFSLSYEGPWVEQLEAEPEFSWMAAGRNAQLRVRRRFYVHAPNEKVRRYAPPTGD